MTLNQAKELYRKGLLLDAEILANPGKTGDWFMTIRDQTCKSYLLVNDNDQVISLPSVDTLLSLVREIGLRSVSIRLG